MFNKKDKHNRQLLKTRFLKVFLKKLFIYFKLNVFKMNIIIIRKFNNKLIALFL